jgi:hypothetical protein
MTPQEIKQVVIKKWFIENRPDLLPDDETNEGPWELIYHEYSKEIEPFFGKKLEELPTAVIRMCINARLTKLLSDYNSLWARVKEVYYTDFEKDYEDISKCGVLNSRVLCVVNRLREKGYDDYFLYINGEAVSIDEEELRQIIHDDIAASLL